jgi:hypothetical protein
VFYDPNPTRADSDLDLDGLTDEEERGLSVDSATFGLSDPGIRDIFLEIDWAGNQWKPEWYSISDVASQFYYHGYPLHIDAGELGGGQEILLKESLDSPKGFLPKLYLSSSRGTPSVEQLVGKYLAPSRHGLFRYVVATAIVENRWSLFGLSRMPILDDVGEMVPECCPQRVGMMVIKSDFLDHVSDLESIVLMHELGHSLGLCHRDQDQKPPHPVSPPHCPHNPNDRHGSYCTDCRSCSHYWTSSDSETAMGSGFKVSTGGGIIGATIGFALGGLPGGVTGGVFGATVSSISDALGREVNFSESEWRALELRGIDHW